MHRRAIVVAIVLHVSAARADAPVGEQPAAAASAANCRTSRFAKKWIYVGDGVSKLHVEDDLDGDGARDVIVGEIHDTSEAGEREVRINFEHRKPVSATLGGSFYEMLDDAHVKGDLSDERVKRVLEEALADEVCDAPDPSLARLLGDRRWWPGPPRMPRAYLYNWTFYKGHNHARDSHAGLDGKFRELDRRGGLVLLATAHGLVLTDEQRTKHAWIYVTRQSPRKLRFPSVGKAELGDGVVILHGTDSDWKLPLPPPK